MFKPEQNAAFVVRDLLQVINSARMNCKAADKKMVRKMLMDSGLHGDVETMNAALAFMKVVYGD